MELPSWAAIIPAYNAASTIGSVVAGVSRYIPLDRVLVVDDGSVDGTADAVQASSAQLLRQNQNGGKGLALRQGFVRALEWRPTWILCLDADGQHDPGAIPEFQDKARKDKFDLIIGRRADLTKMPLLRRFSNRTSSLLLSWRTRMKLHDVQCGYRALRADIVHKMNLYGERYEIEAEMILEAWRLKCRIGWVDIPTLYQGQPSFIRKTPETIRFLKLLVRSFYE